MPDNVILLKHLLRSKFGLDSTLTVRQQQNILKSDDFGNTQQHSLEYIHRLVELPVGGAKTVHQLTHIPHDILLNSLKPNLVWSTEKCELLSDHLFGSVTSLQDGGEDECEVKQNQSISVAVDSTDNKEEVVLVDDEAEIQLSIPQDKMVQELKAAIEAGQLLGFLQGFPGAGKTTTCKKMEDVTGLKVLFCGSTGTASAQFYSRTINYFLSLGLSVDNIDLSKATTSGQVIAKVVSAVENYDLILIDEASMITPVTLARIDLRLRHCFDPELPFGGKHILLCGDM